MKWKFWQSNDTDITQDHSEANDNKGPWGTVTRVASALIGLYLLGAIATGIFWSLEPAGIDAFNTSGQESATASEKSVTGSTTTATFIAVTEKMLNKSGGYLSNDIFPPGVWLDNMHNWEFGVLTLLRDTARVYRNDLSRSQSQSAENKNLAEAEGKFFFKNDSWFLPSTENTYAEGIDFFKVYQQQLANNQNNEAQFYARADNLQQWLATTETRLGSLSQRLSASVGKRQLNTDLAGDSSASQSTNAPSDQLVQTPWLEIDDVFYEARGFTWALIHLLKAVENDFGGVLDKKAARVSLRQIIRELEPTQQTLWSPMVLNGDGFGIVANHSLIMASHISRTNAAITDLRALLTQG
jgi:hypothetical protein